MKNNYLLKRIKWFTILKIMEISAVGILILLEWGIYSFSRAHNWCGEWYNRSCGWLTFFINLGLIFIILVLYHIIKFNWKLARRFVNK